MNVVQFRLEISNPLRRVRGRFVLIIRTRERERGTPVSTSIACTKVGNDGADIYGHAQLPSTLYRSREHEFR